MRIEPGIMPQIKIAKKEEITRRGFVDTLRTIVPLPNKDDYVHSMGFSRESDFLAYICGKGNQVVGDWGSGYDGLAFDAIIRHLPVTIVSLNPGRTDVRFRTERRIVIQKGIDEGLFPGVNENINIDSVLDQVDNNAIASFAHDLTDQKKVTSNSLDIILDSFGPSHYSGVHNMDDQAYVHFQGETTYVSYKQEIYMLYLLEALRVLKVGGRLRIHDGQFNSDYIDTPTSANWKMHAVKTLAALHLVDYTLIRNEGSSSALGIEIKKLKDL